MATAALYNGVKETDMAIADWDKLGQEAVTEIIDWAKGAKEFVSGQAPELVREVIAWGFWFHLSVAIGFAVVALMLFLLLLRAIKSYPTDEEKGEILGVIGMTTGGLVISTVVICVNLYWAMLAYTSPRMYLLEYLKGMSR